MTEQDGLAITFDIDWAPDWCIMLCAELCRAHGARATFFVTHPTPLLADLARDGTFELGLHPNLLPGSSHGAAPEEILDFCLGLVPEARALRTHGLTQSSPLLALIADRYPTLETDVSLFLPFHPGLRAVDAYMGRSNRRLVRLPYFWEDDVAAAWPGWDWTRPVPPAHGLRIYDFHPMHVALNMSRMEQYYALRDNRAGTPLQALAPDDCAAFRNPGAGTRSFLERLLTDTPGTAFRTVSDLAERHRGRTS